MAILDQIGPCTHGVVDEICGACTIDNYWQAVLAQIPSRHFRGEHLERAMAYRRRLAEEALEPAAGGKRGGAIRYLEIGVRLGHSFALTCMAAGNRLECAVGIDPWIEGYGGEPNAGADEVRSHLVALGIDIQKTSLLTGDSHDILPLLAAPTRPSGRHAEPERFNLILVDGDHTAIGAARDLHDSLELLEPGGLLVFDDARVRGNDMLLNAWREVTADNPRILTAGEELTDEPGWTWAIRAGT